MKKIIALIVTAILLTGSLAACGNSQPAAKGSSVTGSGSKQATEESKLKVVTTIFPIYDWVENILGENAKHAEVDILLDNGVDLHSFQPTVDDILKISDSDVFIYVGGESDAWVDDALKQAVNKDMVVINLLEALGKDAKEEEVIEGMQAEKEEEAGEEGPEYDEHVWLSLKNAMKLVQTITDALSKVDSDCADIYKKNMDSYLQQLSVLDSEYEAAVEAAPVKTLLFGDRFPFRYLTDDYGLDYYAAFVGCSAETEASFETITFLANKIDELSLNAVMTIEGSDRRIAETIVQSTKTKDQKILSMDSLQSVTADAVAAGTTYLSVMEKDLDVLKEALK